MKNRKKFVSVMAGVMAAVLLLSLILSLIPAARAASSGEIRNQIDELKAQQKDIRQEITDLREQYEKNSDEIADIIARKMLIDQEVFLILSQIDNINAQLGAFALLIADKQEELEEAQVRFQELNREHRARIRAMEEEGTMSYWEVLFRAKSFSDLLDRLNMIQEIAAADRRRLESLADAANAVQQAQDQLQAEKADLEKTHQEMEETFQTLEDKKKEAEQTLAELVEKGQNIEDFFVDYELRESELMAEIAKMEQDYNNAKYQEWLKDQATATTEATTKPKETEPQETKPKETEPEESRPGQTEPEETKPVETEPEETEPPETEPEETEPKKEGWIVPCSYVMLTSPFGYRDPPKEGASYFHEGVDLAGPEGTPIYAARSGTVTIAKYSSSAGYYVSINHGDGFSSIYMHMTSYVVSKGQTVTQGQLIGYMGSTGISTGSHLHFGIALNGTYVNPALYVPLY